MAKGGLGKGLSALIPTLNDTKGVPLEHIPVSDITPNPHQPRKHFDPQAFEEMVASVKEFGIVQPIIVKPQGPVFQLIAGERRWLAAKEAGLKTIPALVKKSTRIESLEIALIENLQREDLNAIEEATAYEYLIEECGLTHEELGKKIGKSRVAVTNILRLLRLPPGIKQFIIEGSLSEGHARPLLSLEDEEKQKELALRIIEENLTVRQVEKLVRLGQISAEHRQKRLHQPKAFKILAGELRKILSAPVRVKMTSKKGKIEIDFNSMEELERIFKLISNQTSIRFRPPSLIRKSKIKNQRSNTQIKNQKGKH